MNTAPDAAVFEAPEGVWVADTCEPLIDAWERGDVSLNALARGTYPGQRFRDGALPGVKTIGHWDADRDQMWGLDWHRNEGIEITYVATGSLGFGVGRESWRLRSGDLTVTRPWQRHRVGNPNVEACRLQWLILDVGVRRPDQPWSWPDWIVLSRPDLERLTTLLRHCEQPVWRGGTAMGKVFERVGAITEQGFTDASAESRLVLAINWILVELLELLEQKTIVLDEHLSTVMRTVEHFLLEELPVYLDLDWNLASMAEHCGLGRTRFSHYVRAIVNMPPIRYLNECRIRRSVAMLVDRTDLTITDIAFACGFRSSQYFATAFRQATGESPSEFRRQQLTPFRLADA